jgi:hypothetical protein
MYKCLKSIIFLTSIFTFSGSIAKTLLFEDFESGLQKWAGSPFSGYNGYHAGFRMNMITSQDPINCSNRAASFVYLASGGDAFSQPVIPQSNNGYVLEFDYLGIPNPNNSSAPMSDLGGFIGVLSNVTYFNQLYTVWMAGTREAYPGLSNVLTSNYAWQHYKIPVPEGITPTSIIIEQFDFSSGLPGQAYFDNVLLTDGDGPTPATPVTLFQDNFENGLGQWVGKNGGTGYGIIANDPLRQGNKVMSFTQYEDGGDMFTLKPFQSYDGEYTISFDYLGLAPGGCGSVILSSDTVSIPPANLTDVILAFATRGIDVWREGNGILQSNNHWQHYALTVKPQMEIPVHLGAGSWVGCGNFNPQQTLIDNIVVTGLPAQ